VVLYLAATGPSSPQAIERLRLGALPGARVDPLATLYVPPRGRRAADPAVLARIGVHAESLSKVRLPGLDLARGYADAATPSDASARTPV
jgi:hypothetical protein